MSKAQTYTKETILNIGVEDRGFSKFNIGDTVEVSQRVKEGNKERLQIFKGDVIAMHKKGISSTFTVRKIGAHSIPVERIYPFASPLVASIRVTRRGKVRRAKLYYIRERIGKAAKIKELVEKKADKA